LQLDDISPCSKQNVLKYILVKDEVPVAFICFRLF
jgi:hypothetical protein